MLGLIESTAEHHLIVKEKRLRDYLNAEFPIARSVGGHEWPIAGSAAP